MTIANASSTTSPLDEFQWTPQPQAEALVLGIVNEFLARCPYATTLAGRMVAETGTRFQDWIDHIAVKPTTKLKEQLGSTGYVETTGGVYRHPGGIFPPIRLDGSVETHVALKVDSVVDFVAANDIDALISAGPGSRVRTAAVAKVDGLMLSAAERHGVAVESAEPGASPEQIVLGLNHFDAFRTRRRRLRSDSDGFDHSGRLLDKAGREIGRDWACDLFFAAEREFWMRRNHAAQIQYARQQRLGLGWANHDHHTYRSSREHFARLVAVWEMLGFVCRERFYAGAEAGWGAQVMEHPVTGIVTFNDVDLSPEELFTDFAHEPLPERKELGTVGLWCKLHGESFLEAGMHHLECVFDFDALKKQLEGEYAVKVMKPFSDFPHLRQAFTEGERWAVRPEKIEALRNDGRITLEQAERFRVEGAIGSHLENLERNAGFKGFNQKGVSEIISATDPRKQPPSART